QVFRSVRGLFRADHIFQGGDGHATTTELDLDRAAGEVRETFRSGRPEGEVEVSEPGHEVQELNVAEKVRIAWETHSFGCVRSAQACLHLTERGGQPLQIGALRRRAYVHVEGWEGRAVQNGGQASDQHIPHG